MRWTIRVLSFVLLVCLALSSAPINAGAKAGRNQPVWSRLATSFKGACLGKPKVMPAPNQKSSVSVLCDASDLDVRIYSLDIDTPDHRNQRAQTEEGAEELLWAPDSHAFFVNGGASAIGGFLVTVYIPDSESGARPFTVTDKAQIDMVKSFPPCKAWRIDRNCNEVIKDPQYNMSGLAWTPDSSAIFVFAEIPPSSSYGGIMGQVMGYEIAVPSGEIRARLPVKEVKEKWSKYAAWPIRDPGPPQYELAK
jgi:hypothetical protein